MRLSAPSRAGSADVAMLFGRGDGESKVSSPREDGVPPPPSLATAALAATAAAALSCAARSLSLPPLACPLTNHHCRAASLGSNMPNPMRSVQDGKDDFQARRAPRTRLGSGSVGKVRVRVRVRVMGQG